ncbi:CRISPR-associated endonuclease Cas2 [Psychromonas antarctica]|uniref:CRISPR-associated endonuclease Cas2 n=1 Tax=Psychromonas antarctica TaxID=67573 RepID=UPI001EE80457|nr:CRISPR-associated endonuclease Cas2 [Psychromonas antarctica]MCG6201143.1 CRISPR-associated endonuclease Cas2 [Psychromonas antarctica]
MLVLVTYDVSFDDAGGAKRLRRIAKICQDHGVRVQYSVFECDVDPAQWVVFKSKLFEEYDSKIDSLRFYKLGKNGQNRIEHHGAKPSFDIFKDPLVI